MFICGFLEEEDFLFKFVFYDFYKCEWYCLDVFLLFNYVGCVDYSLDSIIDSSFIEEEVWLSFMFISSEEISSEDIFDIDVDVDERLRDVLRF